MIKNKVQWKRSEEGTIELFVFEPTLENLGSWKLYTTSKCFVPDLNITGASRGLETFRLCLKQKYTVVNINGDPLNDT